MHHTLYVVQMESDFESFIKVGFTTKSVKERFQHLTHIYKVKTIFSKRLRGELCYTTEQHIHFALRKRYFSYTPKFRFGGWTECYKQEFLTEIKDTVAEFIPQDKVGEFRAKPYTPPTYLRESRPDEKLEKLRKQSKHIGRYNNTFNGVKSRDCKKSKRQKLLKEERKRLKKKRKYEKELELNYVSEEQRREIILANFEKKKKLENRLKKESRKLFTPEQGGI